MQPALRITVGADPFAVMENNGPLVSTELTGLLADNLHLAGHQLLGDIGILHNEVLDGRAGLEAGRIIQPAVAVRTAHNLVCDDLSRQRAVCHAPFAVAGSNINFFVLIRFADIRNLVQRDQILGRPAVRNLSASQQSAGEHLQILVVPERADVLSGFVILPADNDEVLPVPFHGTQRAGRLSRTQIHSASKICFRLDGKTIGALRMQA
ncbi:hypothetical protein D3C80_1356220 [compost metagenome]